MLGHRGIVEADQARTVRRVKRKRCAERGFTGQHWLTFRQALNLGGHVRKGERGTTVVFADRFIPYRERARAAEAGDEPEAIPFLKRFTLFNADQCADLPAEIAPPARSRSPTT